MTGIVSTITIDAIVHSVYAFTADPVQDADDYFAARLGASSWTDAATLLKQQSIITAVRFLDRGVLWSGVQTDPSTPQPLQWPRDSATCRGDSVTDDTVPDNIVHGEFELALALIEDEAIQDGTGSGSNIKEVGAGSAKVVFFRPTQGDSTETRFPTIVSELVVCYQAGSSLGGPLASGVNIPENVDEQSSFDSCTDSYNLNQGYP